MLSRYKEDAMNWFKRHLNWTLLVILFIGVALYAVADMVSWYVLMRIIAIVFMLVGQMWYLTNKSRSLGWIFLNLIGGVAYAGGSHVGIESSIFGAGVIMLFLKNKEHSASKDSLRVEEAN